MRALLLVLGLALAMGQEFPENRRASSTAVLLASPGHFGGGRRPFQEQQLRRDFQGRDFSDAGNRDFQQNYRGDTFQQITFRSSLLTPNNQNRFQSFNDRFQPGSTILNSGNAFNNQGRQGTGLQVNQKNLFQQYNQNNRFQQQNKNSFGSFQQENQNLFNSFQQENQNRFDSFQQEDQDRFGSFQQGNQNSFGSFQQENQSSFGSFQQENRNRLGPFQENQNRLGSFQQENQNRLGSFQQENQNRLGSFQQENQSRLGSFQQNNQNNRFAMNSFAQNNQRESFNQERSSRFQDNFFRQAGRDSQDFYDGFTEPLNLPSGASRLMGQIDTSFQCSDRPYGYYADQGNECRVFHVCNPYLFTDGRIETHQYSFMCGEGRIFDQEKLTCVEEYSALPCQEASNFYFRNEDFGRPEEKF